MIPVEGQISLISDNHFTPVITYLSHVVEVGRYAAVRSTGTSTFYSLEYRDFFLRTSTGTLFCPLNVGLCLSSYINYITHYPSLVPVLDKS